jgi:pantoate--beta-alanine ligase
MPPTAAILNQPSVITSASKLYRLVRAQQLDGKRVGLVPTMGALHAGHLSLVKRSLQECDSTVVSIFVNPLQYPRPLEADLAKLAEVGVPFVFNPSAAEMYPSDFVTHVEVTGVSEPWEGAIRPGHFRGVATVVLKLFQIAPADRAYFGRKDYQQALVVRRMVSDLNVPTEIVVCPLIRDADGLALSSRNVYLSPDQRQHALAISRSLRVAREMFTAGEHDATKIRDAVRSTITAESGVNLEYAAVVDPETLAELSHIDSSAVVLIAARVGATRLIDNEVLGPPAV